MDVQTLAPLAFLALPLALCIVIVMHFCNAYLDHRAHQQRTRALQQEHQELLTLERVRQAVVQKEVEVRLLALLAQLHRLKQITSSPKNCWCCVSASLMPLDERRLGLEHCAHLLYAMALDRRVTLQEVENLEIEVQNLWSRYSSVI